MFFEHEDVQHMSANQKAKVIAAARRGGMQGITTDHYGRITGINTEITPEITKAALDYIAERAKSFTFPWQKDMRPHDIVPSLRDFKVPAGDFSVGLEIEHRMTSDARHKAVDWLRNEPRACMDADGGSLFEATFPPILFSEITDDWGPYRYSRFLHAEKLTAASYALGIGIHVNVGSDPETMKKANANIYYGWDGFPNREKNQKYFNRQPYGGIYQQAGGKFWEMKMFACTTDVDKIGWYATAGVAILKTFAAGKSTADSIYAALEVAYNEYWDAVKERNERLSAATIAAAATPAAKPVAKRATRKVASV